MPIDIDGYAVLGAIARKPKVFPAIKDDVSKMARTLVVKQLKDRSMPVESLKGIAAAIDRQAFDLVIDMMSDAEIKTLVGKVDKLNIEAMAQTPEWQRKHVSDLASGTVAPAAKTIAAKAPKQPSAKKESVERAANARFAKAKKRV